MNALVKKEVRQLTPSFCACCALALPNLFFRFNADGSLQGSWWFIIAFGLCGAMAVMLGLASFGGEMGTGTFSNLLAQPVSRQKIWETKIMVLAVSFLIVGIVWAACGLFRLNVLGRDLNLLDLFTGVGMFGLVVFSGGLWTVLLLRQVAAAFWFTVLVPAGMLILVSGLFGDDEFGMGVLVCVLGGYSLGGFFFARWLFFRAQDLQWSGAAIVLPETRGLAWLKFRSAIRAWHPRVALWRKEIMLQQSQFVMAFALLVLHLGVLATRKFGSFQRNSATEFILEIFWGLWLVLPMLVGASAVAEERKLGTLAVQLCQPVKRRAQFEIKFSTVLLLSALFGVVVPLVLEGTRILPDIHFFSDFLNYPDSYWADTFGSPASTHSVLVWYGLAATDFLTPLLFLLALAMTIGAISFYASTLARNTLQALAPAVLGLVCFGGLLVGAFRPELLFHYPLWHGLLIYVIGLPVLAVAGLALSFRNWQQLEIGLTTLWRNLAGLAIALVFSMVATTAIYHRTWEKLTAYEPAHGQAQLSLSKPPVLRSDRNSFSVQLPDGRVWLNYWEMYAYPVSLNPLSALLGNFRLTNSGSVHSIAESNNFVNGFRAVVQQSAGIKADGTLWVWEPVATMVQTEAERRKVYKEMKLVQFGSETIWSSLAVARHELSLLLVKQDGTLWRWGVTNVYWDSKTNWPGLRSFPPQRLGTESNWAEVFEADDRTFLRKTDGTIWTTWINDQGQPKITLEPRFTVECATVWGRAKWRSHTAIYGGLINNYNGSSFQLGDLDDGSFRILADRQFNHHTCDYDWKPANLALGQETNWLAVAGTGEKVVTLKNDGTLWLWNFQNEEWRGWAPERHVQIMLPQSPIRLGTHADWVGVTSMDGGIISLAADGSLWYWPLENAAHFGGIYGNVFYNYTQLEPLLDISRKPQCFGNLFGEKAGQLATATQ